MPEGHLVLIVENDPAKVEADLKEGRATCPACGGVLARWSFARRRFVRAEVAVMELRPRRARCRRCAKTQVLLPDVVLCRRVDTVAVIGRALTAAGDGAGCRRAAVGACRPLSTVRGWLRRLRAVAAQVAVRFSIWAHRLDANLAPIAASGSVLADALEAIGVAARAASLRLGPRPCSENEACLATPGLCRAPRKPIASLPARGQPEASPLGIILLSA